MFLIKSPGSTWIFVHEWTSGVTLARVLTPVLVAGADHVVINFDLQKNKNTVGIRNPTIQNPESFKIQAFLRSVFYCWSQQFKIWTILA